MNVIRNEEGLHGCGAMKKSREGKKDGGAQDDDEDEPEATESEDDDSRRPSWPGLDALLPMHTTLDF